MSDSKSNSEPPLCPCGFFGSVQTSGLCSQCFKEKMQRQNALESTSSMNMDDSQNLSCSQKLTTITSTSLVQNTSVFTPENNATVTSAFTNIRPNLSSHQLNLPVITRAMINSDDVLAATNNGVSLVVQPPTPLFSPQQNNGFSATLENQDAKQSSTVSNNLPTLSTLHAGVLERSIVGLVGGAPSSCFEGPPNTSLVVVGEEEEGEGREVWSKNLFKSDIVVISDVARNSCQNMIPKTQVSCTPSYLISNGGSGPAIAVVPCDDNSNIGMDTLTPPSSVLAEEPMVECNDNGLTPPPPSPRPVQKNKRRCFKCRCKLELAFTEIGRCKCDYVFCELHRLPEQHDCTFNHKEKGRQEARDKMISPKKHVGTSLRRLDSDS